MNKAFFVGRLTKAPEVRGNGEKVVVFTVAITRPYVNKENVREADFIQIKAFRKLGENCANWLQKGSMVAIEATVRTGSYEKDGQRVYTIDFVAESVKFLAGPNNANSEISNGKRSTSGGYPSTTAGSDPYDDELPFLNDDVPF